MDSEIGGNIARKAAIFRLITTLAFLVLFVRIFDLQIIRGSYFRSLSDDNRIRRVGVSAPRGSLLARGGEFIAQSKPVERKIIFAYGALQTVDIKKGGSEVGRVLEWERDYPLGGAFSHITGYLGEADQNEVGRISGKCPHKGPAALSSRLGRGGLEEEYDCILRGIDGEEIIEVDSLGNPVRILGRRDPTAGENIETTIDFGLQKKASEIFGDKSGTLIATNKKGEVLALFSSPTFDPNIFIEKKSKEIEDLLFSPKTPLLNRAISGRYHPGSVYKPLVLISAFSSEKVDTNFLYEDLGRIVISSPYGNFSFSNWYFSQYGGTEGVIDAKKALSRSTDTFFYEIGALTGIDEIVHWTKKFGLSEKTKIDLPGEISGLVPDRDWKEEVKGERWFLGDTYNISIGQGDLAVTPIAMHAAISALSDGRLCRPRLVQEESEDCLDMEIREEYLEVVLEGMVKACQAGGTGYTFFDFADKYHTQVACKTGTAQNVGEDPHSWFTLFFPAKEPEIILTVLVENGGEGSKVAGPIAREIVDWWFKDRIERSKE